ncbi:short-chain dehydrogenase [Moniliophthora roreri]|nr:short-chain dehydrogenase [Moniliophthora roreri]
MAFLDLLKKGATIGGTASSVIMISSVALKDKITYNVPAYTASKAGINYLTTALVTEFARNKIPIHINCIVPGTFPSELGVCDEDKLNELLRACWSIARSYVCCPTAKSWNVSRVQTFFLIKQ